MNLKDTTLELIKKPTFELKDGKELELSLKARLTKKEFKLLKAIATNEVDSLQAKLNLTALELNSLKQKLIKKLNYEKTKDSLYKKE